MDRKNKGSKMQKSFIPRAGVSALGALLVASLTACGGGGQAPILGGLGIGNTGPFVSSVTPASYASAVPINARQITATFNTAMDASTFTAASFTLACPSGTPVTGTVSYVAASRSAVLALPASPFLLPVNTLCVASISTAVKSASGQPLSGPFSWKWTTSATPDLTPPTVASTVHANGASNVPINSKIGATFSEPINILSLNSSSFLVKETVSGNPVAGSLAVSGNNAVFTPSAYLLPGTQYSVTAKGVPSGVSDIAGNVMLNDYVWSWTTANTASLTPPTLASSNPVDLTAGVCMNKTVNATFSAAMDPQSINNSSFTLATAAGAPVSGLVSYDAPTHIASFNPSANLVGTPATSYIAVIRGGANGVKDLSGNALAADKTIRFTTNASTCASAPVLGAAAPFGGFGGTATLTNDGTNTLVNGDIGVNASSTSITGLRDIGNVYTVTGDNDGRVNGTVYTLTAPPGSVAGAAVTQANNDALLAFNSISPASLPGGLDVSSLAQCPSCGGAGQGPDQLAGRTLPPGVYRSTSGTYGIGISVPGNLTLDAGGDANAVWVFQTAAGTGTLTVGLTGPATPATPIQVLLVNGAQAKNVYWYVPGGATIGTGSSMVGTLLANRSITISTTGGSPRTAVQTRLDGRAIALTAAVTMTNTLINVPAP
jgi:hypothetical protein